MLVGAACRYTGLMVGLTGFLLIVGTAALSHRLLSRMRLLQVPRVAALVTVVTLSVLAGVALTWRKLGLEVTMFALFPVIIMCFTAERLSTVLADEPLPKTLLNIGFTVVLIVLCYLLFGSMLLQGTLMTFPELLLAVLALQIAVGRWTGLRVSELIRFRRLLSAVRRDKLADVPDHRVLGINERNRIYVDRLNSAELIATANDKVLSKTLLSSAGVTVPSTLAIVQDYWDLYAIERQLAHWTRFVVKPARGSQGAGVVVVLGREGDLYHLASGERVDPAWFVRHMREIMTGIYSVTDDGDEVLIESLIRPSDFYKELSPGGICDLRLILVQGSLMAAMLRVPTSISGGKANLHQGAIGIGVDIESGVTGLGFRDGVQLERHPDTGTPVSGLQIPDWSEVTTLAVRAQKAIPLGYVGVDIAHDAMDGPLVLEVNARPGLEIQNVRGAGFAEIAARLAEMFPGPQGEPAR